MLDQSGQPSPGNPTHSVLGDLSPDELFARGMQTVKMTGAGGITGWEPPSIPEASRLFPQYEVMELIGRGGMGAVYKARQLALDRIVAIKLLPLEVSVDRDFAERFKREARTMARMNHPHIVSVFDFGHTPEGHLFFVMEYVEGTTLHHIIKTTGLMPPHALEIIMGVCEALAYAHIEGVVHRDIKPANVLVDVRGRVKVTDFGLARLNSSTPEQNGYTMTGTVLGTPDYMAPEQKRGMRVDHRADIYSLGVMLYEMLCGQVPQGIFDPPSIRVGVDERVDQVVIRAMQQEPDRRYQNTAEMKQEVQTIRASHDPTARAPQPRPRPNGTKPKAGSERKAGSIFMASIAVVGIGVAATVWINSDKEQQPLQAPPAPKTPANRPVEKTAIVAADPKPKVEPPPASPTPPPTPPASLAGTPTTNSTGPSTSLTPSLTQPTVKSSEPGVSRPVSNPEMAASVAQIAPTPSNPDATASPNAVVPAVVVVEPWRDALTQGDAWVKQRDPDRAIEVFERAVDLAENANPPAPPLEVARIYQRIGNLEALRGSPAEARGSLENARRVLSRIKKPSPEVAQFVNEIDTTLRRLPRE